MYKHLLLLLLLCCTLGLRSSLKATNRMVAGGLLVERLRTWKD
jgi:hypothetical protein